MPTLDKSGLTLGNGPLTGGSTAPIRQGTRLGKKNMCVGVLGKEVLVGLGNKQPRGGNANEKRRSPINRGPEDKGERGPPQKSPQGRLITTIGGRLGKNCQGKGVLSKTTLCYGSGTKILWGKIRYDRTRRKPGIKQEGISRGQRKNKDLTVGVISRGRSETRSPEMGEKKGPSSLKTQGKGPSFALKN